MEHALDEQRCLHEPSVQDVRQRVKKPDIVAPDDVLGSEQRLRAS